MLIKAVCLALGLFALHGTCAEGQIDLGMSEAEATAILAVETAAASAALQRLVQASTAMMQAPGPSEAPTGTPFGQGEARATLVVLCLCRLAKVHP